MSTEGQRQPVHTWSRSGLLAGTTGSNYEPPPTQPTRAAAPSQWPMGDMSTVEKDSMGEDHRIYYTRGAELVTNVSKWLRFGLNRWGGGSFKYAATAIMVLRYV